MQPKHSVTSVTAGEVYPYPRSYSEMVHVQVESCVQEAKAATAKREKNTLFMIKVWFDKNLVANVKLPAKANKCPELA